MIDRPIGDIMKAKNGPSIVTVPPTATVFDAVALMDHLGHARFFLAGHDRGARVSHRLAVDHAGRVRRAALLDIAPTLLKLCGLRGQHVDNLDVPPEPFGSDLDRAGELPGFR